MSTPGPNNIVIRIAINPLDNGQQTTDMLAKSPFPLVIGSDVAGKIH